MSSFLSSFLDELIQRGYNLDGTMKPEYRQKLYQDGWSEDKINNLEQIHIRDAAADREDAEWQQELERQRAEWNAQQEAEMQQRAERLGVPYQSPSTITTTGFTRQTRAEKMAGLDREELLSQGFLETDDFYQLSDEDEEAKETYIMPPEWKDIPDIEF